MTRSAAARGRTAPNGSIEAKSLLYMMLYMSLIAKLLKFTWRTSPTRPVAHGPCIIALELTSCRDRWKVAQQQHAVAPAARMRMCYGAEPVAYGQRPPFGWFPVITPSDTYGGDGYDDPRSATLRVCDDHGWRCCPPAVPERKVRHLGITHSPQGSETGRWWGPPWSLPCCSSLHAASFPHFMALRMHRVSPTRQRSP